ncbi:uncharacterized protein N7529_003712 [Penicillium soppii]|uniref:uncharacterized protein n=1 Tax=Penicillium soppii TaxID=69789 RepID=UPI002547CD1C|nr:uncharacterized protein N7529_003712 [Penicillium soppii]KAJ5871359.1 hypothetical protein N7529_003712 [Penicillium soppii]
MLVLWTDPTISLSKREAGQENDAMLAWLEKVLIRVDELHRTLAQQGYQAKKSGGIFEEGDWDHNRVAESRVWRSVEPQLGYWIRTSFYDMFERNDMGFVWGSLMKSKVETGSQATFYDQTTTFRTSGNDGIFRGESDTGATFQCTVDYDHDPITIEMVDRPEKIGWTYMWKCWANINAWENTPVS